MQFRSMGTLALSLTLLCTIFVIGCSFLGFYAWQQQDVIRELNRQLDLRQAQLAKCDTTLKICKAEALTGDCGDGRAIEFFATLDGSQFVALSGEVYRLEDLEGTKIVVSHDKLVLEEVPDKEEVAEIDATTVAPEHPKAKTRLRLPPRRKN